MIYGGHSRVVRQQAQVRSMGRAHGRRESQTKMPWRAEDDVMVAKKREGKEGREEGGKVLRLMQVDSRLTSSRSAKMRTV